MWRVEPARATDLDALLALAAIAGDGITNLPADREAMAMRLDWSCRSLTRRLAAPEDELYILVLRHSETGDVAGTAMIFSRLGARMPFYSYKLSQMAQASQALGRIVPLSVLSLVTDHDGASEVGGLFLHPKHRAGGLAPLLARARYLFIARHRAGFADRIVAELRGVADEAGNSPFWDAIGRRFFGMSFPEADRFNAAQGSQFIAELMPRHPIYTALLPPEAQAVIGQPHPKGRGALAMLAAEGFVHDAYVDIFDGGPTVTARTDALRTLRTAAPATLASFTGPPSLFAAGQLADFRAWTGDPAAGASSGESFHHVPL
ncbi:arginine N-succinyltransferase [Polymorphobacter sp.]|uniref:arginine N-succinyltransferase n=1 Tax=Polymorphobacter sp. TaxID=1909290 RepID=UPI003F704DD5